MRVLIIVVILVALGLGAYFLSQGVPEDIEDATSAPQEVVEETVEEAETATDEAAETAEEAATAVEEAVDEAAGAANDALEGLTEGAGEMAEDATATASEAADSAVEAANDAANAVLEAATGAPEGTPRLQDALTRDGFDFDTAIAAIEGSDVSEMTKRAARAALERARDNPELLPAAIEQARSILGLE
jgi:F0F1-type ATP synthase membrane subunit b/b'